MTSCQQGSRDWHLAKQCGHCLLDKTLEQMQLDLAGFPREIACARFVLFLKWPLDLSEDDQFEGMSMVVVLALGSSICLINFPDRNSFNSR